MKYLSDPTIWVYLTSALISLYGAFLFVWWWIKKGSASSVFAYVTFLFFGEFVESIMSTYARSLRLGDCPEDYTNFLSCGLWPGRKIVTIIALAAIVIHMTYRAFFVKTMEEHRRETD